MKQVLEHIVKSLVVNQDAVNIIEEVDNNVYHYTIKVDNNDFGRIIGHEGKIAKSIRNIMAAIATLQEVKVIIEIKW